MKIEKDTVVTIKYKVSDAQGKLIEASPEPMAYLHGGYENTLPKIEEALDGKEKGYQTVLNLSPEDAFGQRDETLVRSIRRRNRACVHRDEDQGPGRAARRQPSVGGQGAEVQPAGDGRARRAAGGNRAPACAWRPRAPSLNCFF